MKLKDILLSIIAIVGIGLIFYFSVVDPILNGIASYGLLGFILKVIGFLVVFYIVVGMAHYNDK